ncbi:MAG TPA: iron-containing redox enzyme family protein [Polyangiaceae bacterium]|nr:iron-containing redox enzyme family protein [Polyangiaceae bacterium]
MQLADTQSGSSADARAFVVRLAKEALRHRAANHVYLRAIGEGSLPDPAWALRDFAVHYHAYSSHFPRFLTALISRLENAEHRRALLANLTEESGTYSQEELRELKAFGVDPDWINGVPHPQLFLRFCDAVDARPRSVVADQALCWREMLLAVITHGTTAEALGALGLGTENIVRHIYQPFVQAIARSALAPRDAVFFPLHTAVDDHHQETLEDISTAFALDEAGRAGLRRGMLKALALRSTFWDWLYERALDPKRAEEAL